MGEIATYNGKEIKIGTCEDLYYLRADQRHKIQGYTFDDCLRYRFPWPDEDGQEPGSFDRCDRACCLKGLEAPLELASEHHRVQFVAQAGYLVSLPCPESVASDGGLGPIEVGGVRVVRNGDAGRVLLCQQRLYEGRLVAVVRCGGCGLRWRLSREDAVKGAAALQAEAKHRRGSEEWYLKVARRLVQGYLNGGANRYG